jgi:hypothetical protein
MRIPSFRFISQRYRAPRPFQFHLAKLGCVLATLSLHLPARGQVNGVGERPYLGWSSFSQQTIASNFLTQSNIQAQSDAMASSGLTKHG